jgi:hypothetical protein
MLKFNMKKMADDKRISLPDIAKVLKKPYQSIWYMSNKNTIKPNTLGKLEAVYGDLSGYVIN